MEISKHPESLEEVIERREEEIVQQEYYLFNISQKGFQRLLDLNLDMNLLFIIHLLLEGKDPVTIGSHRVVAWLQTLRRKGYVAQDSNEVTLSGQLLYRMLKEDKDEEIVSAVPGGFERWWKIFPSTNMFMYRTKTFEGSQKKNIKKAQCKALFERYVNEGKFTVEDIIAGTEYHMVVVRELSWKNQRNEMSYVPNSYRYLSEKFFEPYIELSKARVKIKDNSNVMDI